jgi:molecular chaperone DnaK
MRKDAESHADEDRKRKELIELRNNADNTAYTAEKALRDFGEKVPADVRSDIEAKTAAVREAAKGEDVQSIRAATEALGQAIQKIGASVYEAPPAAGNGRTETGSGSPGGETEGEVIDGEVKE